MSNSDLFNNNHASIFEVPKQFLSILLFYGSRQIFLRIFKPLLSQNFQ